MAAASIFKGGSTVLFSGRLTPAVGIIPISFSSSPPIAHFTTPFSYSSARITNVNPIHSNRRSFLRFCTVGESSDSTASSSQAPNAPSPEFDPKEAVALLDIRVGRILKAWKHPEADSLYVEEVDVGEPEPRTICSGLVNYIPLHHLQKRKKAEAVPMMEEKINHLHSLALLTTWKGNRIDAIHKQLHFPVHAEVNYYSHAIQVGENLYALWRRQ